MRSISGKFFLIETQTGYDIGEVIRLGKDHCLIQWWFLKKNLMNSNLPHEKFNMLSEGEIIRSAIVYQDWVPFNAIISPIVVLKEREYFGQDKVDANVYFNRGTIYDSCKNTLEFNGELHCLACKKLINPDNQYLIEDNEFNELYHNSCHKTGGMARQVNEKMLSGSVHNIISQMQVI